ncbi:hypothetical protein E2C01_037198 [Portunus trituberculatus]|uniref:Uncharacterized protein n=1 Tax=Portunus trituberculatus TaxID=210409 RepID=A0A5B7FEX8_PORTR|nr:hypothetical protein [Portunus trituberculatus]
MLYILSLYNLILKIYTKTLALLSILSKYTLFLMLVVVGCDWGQNSQFWDKNKLKSIGRVTGYVVEHGGIHGCGWDHCVVAVRLSYYLC